MATINGGQIKFIKAHGNKERKKDETRSLGFIETRHNKTKLSGSINFARHFINVIVNTRN